jgi:cytochrome c-type biogenesis protein CcmH
MQNIKRKLLLTLIVALASLLIVSVAYAQDDQPGRPTDNDVNRVASSSTASLPQYTLVLQTKACEDWRAQIRDQLSEGWTDQQVIDYFVAQYGERVLAEPQRKGFTSLVWFLPMIVALIGLWIVYEILKNWRKQKPVVIATKPLPEIPEAVLKKIERELQEMD